MCSFTESCKNNSYYKVIEKSSGKVIDCCWKCLTEIDNDPLFGSIVEQCPPETDNFKLLKPEKDELNIWNYEGFSLWVDGTNDTFNQDVIDMVMG